MALIDRFSGDLDERRMSLGEHLEELRKHVWKCMLYIVGALAICLCFQERLTKVARRPFDKCMEEIAKDQAMAPVKARLGGAPVIGAAYEEVLANAAIEAKGRKLEQTGTIL